MSAGKIGVGHTMSPGEKPSKSRKRDGGDAARAESENDEAVEIELAGDQKWDAGPLVSTGGKVDASALERVISESEAGEDDAEVRTVRFKLLRNLDKRLDKYLCDRITFMSRNQLQKLIDEGGVSVNGRAPKASTKLNAGDIVEVVVPPPPPTEIQPEDIPLEVMFEDEHLIVINKHPDILVHPARSHNKGTMVNALAYHFRERSKLGGALSEVGKDLARPGVVHRLDRHTSGVIVFAKTEEAHWKLGHSFEHRRVDKRYIAVVHGIVEPDIDVIDLPLGPHPSREKGYREKYVVRHDELGKPSVTVCRVRERYRKSDNVAEGQSGNVGDSQVLRRAMGWKPAESSPPCRLTTSPLGHFSLVELELRTGRTHQIRVHLSHLGWPIVGDDMYGGKTYSDANGNVLIARQALHACILGFTHPITNRRMQFTAPLRGDMASLVRDLRATHTVESPETPGATVDLKLLER
ncbi:MAG: RluA family pseudouridine synthase [Phycisphaeraceae bacterium]|nr:RluA family pseudouridine synthase [Phycisphaeraceae bacterium]